MPEVKVRRQGIPQEEIAAVLRNGLGDGYRLVPKGGQRLEVHKNPFVRARIDTQEEPGGTVLTVRGMGFPFLLLHMITRLTNEAGLAKRVATVIGESGVLRDSA